MLRRVVRVSRVGLFVMGIAFVVSIPLSFFYSATVTFPWPGEGGWISLERGTAELWIVEVWRPGRSLSFEDWIGATPSSDGRISWAIPSFDRTFKPQFPFVASLPLWLLAAICLAWPVTSLLLARRRGKGRGFAVEPAADAVPPAIDNIAP